MLRVMLVVLCVWVVERIASLVILLTTTTSQDLLVPCVVVLPIQMDQIVYHAVPAVPLV